MSRSRNLGYSAEHNVFILELGPKATKEHFHSSGAYGVRITIEEIRAR